MHDPSPTQLPRCLDLLETKANMVRMRWETFAQTVCGHIIIKGGEREHLIANTKLGNLEHKKCMNFVFAYRKDECRKGN
jgi:hypothetical protein